MASVKILLEGFTNANKKAEGEDEKTRCTMALIRDDDFVILSDPGVLDDQKTLVDALAKENLNINDITHIFITHSHMDHYRNLGMFPGAIAIDYWGLWDGAKCEERPEKLTNNIEIIETPGHSYDGVTMLIRTKEGIVALVGDLWWSERGPENDPYASDHGKLDESRQKVLELADFIIPGHGGMFKVKRHPGLPAEDAV